MGWLLERFRSTVRYVHTRVVAPVLKSIWVAITAPVRAIAWFFSSPADRNDVRSNVQQLMETNARLRREGEEKDQKIADLMEAFQKTKAAQEMQAHQNKVLADQVNARRQVDDVAHKKTATAQKTARDQAVALQRTGSDSEPEDAGVLEYKGSSSHAERANALERNTIFREQPESFGSRTNGLRMRK
ncbi:MAG: hypothetical protein A3J38_06900 [Gammaproteobacteria bacterium RIFCSPHIGHO2_12_FULL_45_9]|nr:MAG: hypothetical protein A3J38_06900 [Gammaproteobacteria bacterium RIFCSPHIGHO2_12_FULL_45_9]